jgi:hypothetical protein
MVGFGSVFQEHGRNGASAVMSAMGSGPGMDAGDVGIALQSATWHHAVAAVPERCCRPPADMREAGLQGRKRQLTFHGVAIGPHRGDVQ